MANFMSAPPRDANPQALANALLQMTEQPGDQIGVRPAQWDPSGYAQAMQQMGTPPAARGKSGLQRGAGAAGGAISGATAGMALGPVGGIVGGLIGALAGGLS